MQRLLHTERIQSQIDRFPGSGEPLPEPVRAFFEPRFGADFGAVRVHDGLDAAEAASSVNARAFTFGRHIFFGKGQYAPAAGGGRELLAHELTHTLQQRPAGALTTLQCKRGNGTEPAEATPQTHAGTVGSKISVTVYTGDTSDPAHETAKRIAEKRFQTGEADLAFPIGRIEDIHNTLQFYAYQNKLQPEARREAWEQGGDFFLVPDEDPGFVQTISIIGHGRAGKKGKEPFYGFGEVAYKTSELAKLYENGLDLSRYMVNGGTVVLDGCEAAAGEEGRLFLFQIGRIFFGSKKIGHIKANTTVSMAIAGEMVGGSRRDLAWPADFSDLDRQPSKLKTCDPLIQDCPPGTACFPSGAEFRCMPEEDPKP